MSEQTKRAGSHRPEVVVQIPIKMQSVRIESKNFVDFKGKPLWRHLVDELAENLPKNWQIIIHHDASMYEEEEIFSYLPDGVETHKRLDWLSSTWSNGNHLIQDFARWNFQADIIIQAFVTSPFLKAKTIEDAVTKLMNTPGKDSLVAGYRRGMFYWNAFGESNYHRSPAGLPRTQDLMTFVESTGFYICKREVILQTGCRTGYNPILHEIPLIECIDIDTPEDLAFAERISNE